MSIKNEKNGFQYTVASVDRALELLLILEESSREMGVTDLSKILGVQKSTIHNLLQTLLARDFVRQTESGRYTLGFRLLKLGKAVAERLDIRRLAYPFLLELAQEANEYVLLAVMNKDEIVILDSVVPPRPSFIVPKFDFSQTFHCSAVGKIFLAFGSELLRDTIFTRQLAQYTSSTLIEKGDLLSEIEKVKKQGYAISHNETIEGVTCISAPVFDVSGDIVAAISISSASGGIHSERLQNIIHIVATKASAISHTLGN